MQESQSSKTIFVSHAAIDKEIIEQVVDLLNTGMGIDVQNNVFCSSLEGMKIPPGEDFKHFIKSQIQQPKIVLLLISNNYLSSQFCLAELGASWAMSHKAIPILIPPVKFSDMKAVLANVNALRIDDPTDWNEALELFKKILGIQPNVNRWERKRDQAIEAVKALIPKQATPQIVPLTQYKQLEAKISDANKEISELESTVKEQANFIVELKKLKDSGQVAAAEMKNLSSGKKFDRAIGEAKKELDQVPRIVREALYYEFLDRTLAWGGFGEESKNEEMERAIEKKLLRNLGEEGATINDSHPKIKRAIEALNRLQKFVDRESSELVEVYEEEHDEPLAFTSRYFWETFLF